MSRLLVRIRLEALSTKIQSDGKKIKKMTYFDILLHIRNAYSKNIYWSFDNVGSIPASLLYAENSIVVSTSNIN